MSFKSGGRKCKFETLESRRVLAGNVVAEVNGGTLFIKGDNFSNGVTITAGAIPNSVLVTGVTTGGNPTGINGVPNGAVQLVNVTKGLNVKMGFGNDSVTVNNLTIYGETEISGGAGLDTIALNNSTFCGEFELRGGRGADTVTLINTTTAGKALLSTGHGCDSLSLTGSQFGKLDIQLNQSNDDLSIASTIVVTQSSINGGKGINLYSDGGSNFFGGVLEKLNLNGGDIAI